MPQQVAAIVLAAGRSTRMGRSKQLLPLGNKPVILRCLETLFFARLEDIIVVLGPTGKNIAPVLGSLPVTIAWNNAPESDMAASVRVGLQAVGEAASAVLVCLVDHPLVAAETICTLIRCHKKQPEKIIIPCYRGKKGHPTLFPRAALHELSSVPTLRDVVHKDPARVRLVEVLDPGVVMDMDTPEDYRKILKSYQHSRP